MVKCYVFFAVQIEFLNITWMSFGLKELNKAMKRVSYLRQDMT
jgi:hypothetical protein